jgi:hypothetical protein
VVYQRRIERDFVLESSPSSASTSLTLLVFEAWVEDVGHAAARLSAADLEALGQAVGMIALRGDSLGVLDSDRVTPKPIDKTTAIHSTAGTYIPAHRKNSYGGRA